MICTYTFDFESEAASIATVADTVHRAGAAGFVLTMDPDIGSEQIKGATVTLQIPGLIINNMEASTVCTKQLTTCSDPSLLYYIMLFRFRVGFTTILQFEHVEEQKWESYCI